MPVKKSSSQQLRSDAEKLRETARYLVKYAAVLISKSVELEKTLARDKPGGKP
jgi:hypothetical protein